MRNRFVLWTTTVFFALNLSSVKSEATLRETKTPFKRFALVVGANDGGPQRIELKYAVSDAQSMKRLFEDMGGVSPGESQILADPHRKTLLAEMESLREKINECKSRYGRTEIIFYFSGHSDDSHILLGGEKVSYKEIREAIDRIDSDVRIVILDSCASGAYVRLKGGLQKLPFLMDTAYNMKGYAVMTSSSLLEASQESDLIKGSFFTHYLISGMRGAADVIRDGKVTLSEAYQFAFNETLARTAKTVGGPQHPSYNIQMTGTGDVVMTEIRQSSAALSIDKEISGRLFIYDKDETLIAELTKTLGEDMELGIEPGRYQIVNLRENQAYESSLAVKTGERARVGLDEFVKTKKILAAARGDIPLPHSQRFLKKLSLKISAGLGTLLGGDINTWIDEQNRYFRDFAGIKGVEQNGQWQKIDSNPELKAECLVKLRKNFTVGIGSGCFWKAVRGEVALTGASESVIRFASNIKIKAIPIEASAYVFRPLGPHMSMFFKGGIGYYFGQINYTFRNSTQTGGVEIWKKNVGKATDSGVGIQGGLGWEARLNNRLTFFVEAQGRYCLLKHWKGTETFTSFEGDSQKNSGELHLYYGDVRYFDILRPRLYLVKGGNLGPGKDQRRFSVGLSGISLSTGIKITF